MASKEPIVRAALTVPTSATPPNDVSAALYVGDIDPATTLFQVVGTFNATLQVETSIDKVNWFACGPTLASAGTAASAQTNMATTGTAPRAAAMWARLRCTIFTSIASVGFVATGVPKAL